MIDGNGNTLKDLDRLKRADQVCHDLAIYMSQDEEISGADFIGIVCELLSEAGYLDLVAIAERDLRGLPGYPAGFHHYLRFAGAPVLAADVLLWSKPALLRKRYLEGLMRANAQLNHGPDSRRFHESDHKGEMFTMGCNFESTPSSIAIHKQTGQVFSRSKWSGEDHAISWERAVDWADTFWGANHVA